MVVETPSDRDYACLLCSQGKVKDLRAACPHCGCPIDIGPELQNVEVGSYKLIKYIGRGYYGATFEGKNRIGKPVALKLVPLRLYESHGKSFVEEIERYVRVGSHPNIADLYDAEVTTIRVRDQSVEFYLIVMEWIEGITLTEFIRNHVPDTNVVYAAILDIASGISRFEERNLWHNDLNSDNILVKRLTIEEIQNRRTESPFVLKIVDTGSAVFRQAFKHRILDDLSFLAQHANALVMAAERQSGLRSLEDQFFLDNLGKIIGSLLDENPSRRPSAASSVIAAVTKLYQDRHMLSDETAVHLEYPFEYLNANDFPSASLVSRLFSDRFPWIRDTIVPAAQSMLITGPRGSGKTMILRSMRLRTRLAPISDAESPARKLGRMEHDPFVAFFVSARLEIGNHVPLTKQPAWMASEEAVLCYFNLLYAYEVCDTILYANLKGILHIAGDAEYQFCNLLARALGNEDVVSLSGALSVIKRKQADILASNYDDIVRTDLCSAKFLEDLCSSLRILVPDLASKRIVFLLDDFSTPKIPQSVQRALLPIIWNSGAGYTFRVTAHSESVEVVDLRNNTYLRNRDYQEINIGRAYIDLTDFEEQTNTVSDCIDEILSKRFAASALGKQPSIRKLLGIRRSESIANEIRRRSIENKLRGLRYHGLNTVMSLCSGDISYLIDVVGKMLLEQGSRPEVASIPSNHQDRVIRDYARQELYRLQDFVTNLNLFDIALQFGKMSRFKLEREDVGTGTHTRPAEYLRIEVQLTDTAGDVRNAIAELLRHGVFIDGGFGSSSQGNPTRRLIFRKLYTPAFPTTYRSRDTFPMTAQHFADFVREPANSLRQMISKSGVRPEHQQGVLDGLFNSSG